MGSDPRSRRTDEKVREALALALLEDVKDPRLDLVTVTGVEVSRDRKYARVFVTAHGDEERYAEVLAALDRAKGRLKAGIAARVKMRFTPELKFSIDRSVDEGMKISRILREHAAGQDPEGS
ncbi:MAG: 30S ribosome-binding factor RbfA [Coriobacteriia bacterium]